MNPQRDDGVIAIRPYRPDDAQALYAAVRESVDTVGRWMPWCHADYALVDAERWIDFSLEQWAEEKAYHFAVFDHVGGGFLGACGLGPLMRELRVANLGYWVRSSVAGRGVATRAARLVATLGLEELGLVRIEVVCAVDNVPSQRVAEKLGARREAVLRNRCMVGGNPRRP